MSRIRAFTLIELLIVIAIIAILGSATVLVLNPLELMRQGRDTTRINDIENIDKAVKMTLFNNPALIDSLSATNIYLSLPSSSCPTNAPTGYTYVCNATAANINKVDGTGWIPLSLTNIATLPVDPNTGNTNDYYAFIANSVTKTFTITTLLESEKQTKLAASFDGGTDPGRFEKGDVSLWTKASGLQGYWPMDEGTGTTTADISGSNNTGTLTNNPTWTTASNCKSGNCISFDGVDDYVIVANHSSLSPAVITVSSWVKTLNNSVTQQFISKTEGGSYQLNINYGTGKLGFLAFIAGAYRSAEISTPSVINNKWYHVVGTFDGTTMKLFLDGTQVGSYTQAGTISVLTTSLCFGAEAGPTICNGGNLLNGSLDDIRIYNRALSADEIMALYNANK